MFEKHVFVFRHCVRSTPSSVNLHDDDDGQGVNVPVSALWSVPQGGGGGGSNEPAWNVPIEWCTAQGITISRRTGQWLAKTFIRNPQQTIVRIVSDTSQRDVDTALAVSEGLRDRGIHVEMIELSPDLFRPPQQQRQPPQPHQSACPQVDLSRVLTQMQARLNHVRPPSSVPEALQLIDSLVRLKHHYPNTTTNATLDDLTINVDDLHLKGPVNIIKLLAQMLLYSRASNLVFLPHTTTLQLSTLLPWIAWQRTIEEAFHSQAAQRGAVMATYIMTLLRQSPQQPQRPMVTLIFGHDSTLNQLQTALNVEWSLPLYGTHSPTPPGTALYWHQAWDGHIAVELLVPTYLTIDGTTNTSGILDRKPLLSFSNRNELSQHIQTQLALYDGASRCFHPTGFAATTILHDIPMVYYYGISAAILLLVPATLFVLQRWCKPCCRRQRRGRSTSGSTPGSSSSSTSRSHSHNGATYTLANLELT
jgi:hypothetical protein